ncbi:unnamed protein product [Spirodela intermedia]|uniref:Uncharacterized protein n=2 Tax=Spirodela intermedia TaxID=51605 RepID=A0A7I8J6V5_SPIIN|nr:unnamed protein product [Spirodela intermedia]CAA6665799.1 unnamed protein product [Spirodela intermedia]CAA7402555.1 unnamed protein product [Spirodela intermedia]
MAETSSLVPMLIVCPSGTADGLSPTSRAFLLTTRAEVSMKKLFSLSANAWASSVGTALRWRRSALLPTSMMTILESVWALSSFSHRSTFSNVMWRVTSRRDAGYLSWPAVSHICALMTLSSTLMLRVANSTPIVDLDSRLNSFRVKRDSRFDLPTPESPIRTTLKR